MTKKMSIGEVAKKTQLSVRTLRHYDQIGLLSPSIRGANSYRYYTEHDLNRLYDILFYRALGFSLAKIEHVLSSKPEVRSTLLHSQMVLLDEHIERLLSIKQKLANTLNDERNNMNSHKSFAALNGFDPDEYEAETQQLWGTSAAYKESANRTNQYSESDWARYKKEFNELNEAMAELIRQEFEPNSAQALEVVEKMRMQLDSWFYPCSRQMHAQLGEMYVADLRFTQTYDQVQAGLAQFIMQSSAANFAINGD
jgi:DNA-binding transcriptional MerR regulator